MNLQQLRSPTLGCFKRGLFQCTGLTHTVSVQNMRHTFVVKKILRQFLDDFFLYIAGGGPLGGLYGDVQEEEAIQSVRNILIDGVNYIDTAPWYGQGKSEQRIGRVREQ